MTKKQLKEGARSYAFGKAARSFASDLPIAPVQAAYGAAVGGLFYGKPGLGAAAGIGMHTALAGREAYKKYKSAKKDYVDAKKSGRTRDWDSQPFDGNRGSNSFLERSGIAHMARQQRAAKLQGNGMKPKSKDFIPMKIKESLDNIIQSSLNNDIVSIKNAVDAVLTDKIADRLEFAKVELAQNMFGGKPKTEDDEYVNSGEEATEDDSDEEDLMDSDFELEDDESVDYDNPDEDGDIGSDEDLDTDK